MTAAILPRMRCEAPSPLGRMVILTEGAELVGLHFADHVPTPGATQPAGAAEESLSAIRHQLEEYFGGVRTRFELPIRLRGTPFQVEVWSALLDIPYGGTSTYARLAAVLGRPRAARAVGAANAQNPISIVVPCHRLIGADGGLTGYGGGLERKQRLLELEGAAPLRTVSRVRS